MFNSKQPIWHLFVPAIVVVVVTISFILGAYHGS